MLIRFTKQNDERHTLEIVREDGSAESLDCETKSLFLHDLLHLAVEAEGGLSGGFWGLLASGTTLAKMGDRTKAFGAATDELAAIEQLVGALHGATKGIRPDELVAGMRRFAAALEQSLPDWLTEQFVVRVQERLRRFTGHWKAIPYGGTMEIPWP